MSYLAELEKAASRPARAAKAPAVAPTDRKNILKKIAGGVMSPVAMAFNTLDTGGATLRNALVGQDVTAPISNITGNEGRASGRDVLRHYGLAGKKDTWGNALGGFATEVALDPLTYMSGGIVALNKGAGALARAAGLANKLTRTERATKVIGSVAQKGSLLNDYAGKHGLAEAYKLMSEIQGNAAAKKLDWNKVSQEPVGSWLKLHGPFGMGGEIPINNKYLAGKLDDLQKWAGQTVAGQALGAAFDYTARNAMGVKNQLFNRGLSDMLRLGKGGHYRQGVEQRALLQGLEGSYKDKMGGFYATGGARAGQDPSRDLFETFCEAMETHGRHMKFRDAFDQAATRRGLALDPRVLDEAEQVMSKVRRGMDNPWSDLLSMGYRGSHNTPSDHFSHYMRKASDELLGVLEKERTGGSFGHASSVTRQRSGETAHLPTFVIEEIARNPKYHPTSPNAAADIMADFGQYLGYKDPKTKALVNAVDHANQLSNKLSQYSTVKEMFQPATAENLLEYSQDIGRLRDTYRHVHNYLADHLGQAGSGATKTLNQAFKEMGMRPIEGKRFLRRVLQDRGNYAYGSTGGIRKLGKEKIDDDVFEALIQHKKPRSAPSPLAQKAGEWWDKATNAYKTNWTLPFPSFHTRNRGGGVANNLMFGPGNPAEKARYLKEELSGSLSQNRFLPADVPNSPDPNTQMALEMASEGVTGNQIMAQDVPLAHTRADSLSGKVMDVGQSWRDAGLQVTDPKGQWYGQNLPYIGKPIEKVNQAHKALIDTGAKGAGVVEYHNRANMYRHLRKQGYNPAQAAKEVEATQFLYENATNFEKNVMKRAIPFWGFLSNQAKLTAKGLYNSPGGAAAQSLRATSNATPDDQVLPPHLADQLAIPLGESPTGGQRYLSGFGNPVESAMPYLTAAADPQGAGLSLLSSSHPFLKAPLEMATGQTFFQRGPEGGGRPLRNLDPAVGRILQAITDRKGAIEGQPAPDLPFLSHTHSRMAEQAIANTPASRYINFLRTATDPRKAQNYGLDAAINLLSPAKMTEISPQEEERLIQAASNALADSLGAGEWKNRYFSEMRKAAMTEQQRKDAEALEQIWKESKRRAGKYSQKQRKGAKKKPATPDRGRAVEALIKMAEER